MIHPHSFDKPITAVIDNEIILIDEIFGNIFHFYASFMPDEEVLNVFPDGATAEKTNDTKILKATNEQEDVIWGEITNKGYIWDSENHRFEKSTLTIMQV